MYPSGDLKRLALRREYLQLQIELRREHCLGLGRQIEAKLEKWMRWGRILRAGLWGAASLGLLRRGRRSSPEEASSSRGGQWLRWTPIAWRAVRLVTGW
jgi:hypothetical protein